MIPTLASSLSGRPLAQVIFAATLVLIAFAWFLWSFVEDDDGMR